MTQYVINIGAIPNDGTGDPLRTAFNEVNLNFDQVFAAGPVLSNVQIANNTILTTNTNGNLVLAPNGIGVVQSNVSIVPNTANIRNLGSASQRWATVYTQYLNSNQINLSGDLTVGGNLTVTGDIIEMGNIVTDALTIQLANTASTANAANGAGITVGANDSIATMLYNSGSNIWVLNIGLETSNLVVNNISSDDSTFVTIQDGLNVEDAITAAGNISAPYFLGNGSLLTGIASTYGNADVATYLASGTVTTNILTTANIAGGNINGGSISGGNISVVGNIVGNNITASSSLSAGSISTAGNISGNLVAPGGNGQVMYNRNGVIGASPIDFNFDESTETLFVKVGSFSGNANGTNALYAGNPGFTILGSAVMAQFTGNVPDYSQINFQNTSNSVVASGDYIITADNGNDTTHFIDLGITSSTWDGTQTNSLGNRLGPNDGYLYVQDGNLVIGTSGGNINVWKFGIDGNVTAGGNLIPEANSTLSLGNATNQWSDLYVSNATIYMNNVPIGLTSGNVLTVDGADVVTTAANGSTSLGNVTFNGNVISTSGTNNLLINLDGENFIANTANGGAIGLYSGNSQIDINNDTPGIEITSLNVNLVALDEGTIYIDATAANGVVDINSDGNTTITVNGNAWVFDNSGNLAIPGNIVANDTILIDNRESGVIADISIYSADNILLQGADRTNPGEPEGGDISILAGAGAADSGPGDASGGGDILIEGGSGGAANVYSGASGGFINITAGRGGDGSVANAAGAGGSIEISAGDGGSDNGNGGSGGGSISLLAGDSTDTTQDRGSITLISGNGGDETTAGGYVEINIPSVGTSPGGSWIFTNTGTVLETPNNAEIFNVNAGNLTVGSAGNTIVRTIGAGLTTYDWVFDPTGNLNLPTNGSINFNAGGITQATDEDFVITVNDADNDGFAIFNRITDTDGNVVGQTELRRDRLNINLDMLGSNYQWQFSDNQGIMYLPGNISGNYGSDTSFFVTDNGSGGTMEMKTISYIGDTLGSNVRVTQSNATISTSNAAYTWTFDNTGNLTVPGDGVIRSIDDTIQLQSYDTSNSITRGLRVGTNGGLFLEIGNNQPWLAFTNDSGDAEIGAAPGVAGTGNAGYSLTLFGGPADTSVYGTGAGGNINLQAGLGATNDGGGGGPGGWVNITAGNSYDPAGVAGNVTINSGSSTWTFDNTGNLTVPGNIIGTVAQATLANTVAVSSVLLNQEYVPALLVANTGNLGIKAADGTANITYNPAQNRLTVENIAVGNVISATGNVTVAGTGGISITNLPAFRVYGTSSNNIAGGTTVTATQGATVDYNTGSSYNNTTGIFTAPVGGIYSCAATVRVGNTDTLNQVSIQKNSDNSGANVVAFWECTGNSTSQGLGHFSMAGMTKLAVGDTLRLQVVLGNVNFDSNDSYSVTFLG